MNQALILHDPNRGKFLISSQALGVKAVALEAAGVVMRVTNPDENQTASEAQTALKTLIADTEKERKRLKEPILKEGYELDKAAAEFIDELQREHNRIARLCGDYQAVLESQRRAAEVAQREELARVEREKAEALTKANTIEQITQVQEAFAEQAKAAQEAKPVPEPVRAKGQVIKTDWEIESIDVHVLYKHHPWCVSLEARVSEIKAALSAGQTLKGVKARQVTKADVRPGKATVVEV